MEINEWFRLAVGSTLLSTLACFGEEWTDDAAVDFPWVSANPIHR